jgi:cation-transporting ATPase 13A3/4/5
LLLIVHKTPHRDIALFPLKALDYPYPLSTVFAASSSNPSNGVSDHVQNGKSLDEIVSKLIAVDYRYQRFALDPRTGEFATVKFVLALCY